MAGEIIVSAVAEEMVKQAFAGLIGRQAGRPDEKEQHMERLEMAQIKLEAVLETSRKWHIKGAPSLLRWRKKLKRAARECDDTLRECKQRAIEDEVKEQEVKSSSFPRRLAHATKSLVKAFFFNRDSHDYVERFERLADGASEFLRFVELGGTPRRYMMLHPLIGRLLAGQELRYRLVRRSKYHLFCVRPICLEDDRGMEAKLLFVYEDDEAPEKNLCLGSILRLSESMDLVGTVIKCLEMLFTTPQFKPIAESARKEISQLPTQDFLWVPYVDASHKEHWNTVHINMTKWFRPNPMCCKQHDSSTIKQSDISVLEPVIEVSLQGHIPLSEYNMHSRSKAVEGESSCLKNLPHLKLGLLFSPHGCSEGDLDPQVESSAVVVIDGIEQSGDVRINVSLEELDEFMLPKAIDCLHRKADTTAYQIFWKTKHGTAFLLVEKTCLTKMPPRCISSVGDRRWVIQRRRDPKLERWIRLVKDFLNLWVAHAPPRLQSSLIEWIQKANEMQLAGLTN
ncbi:unnamed protein product [Urochloa decumbens]|uniref:Rx N-terminal domain-containing protein n=1 Tax=Urochloa decumbens TaxID=240449 RepID=A0ABC8WBB0_9POAL